MTDASGASLVIWILGAIGSIIVVIIIPIIIVIWQLLNQKIDNNTTEINELRKVRHDNLDAVTEIKGRVKLLEFKFEETLERIDNGVKQLSKQLTDHMADKDAV